MKKSYVISLVSVPLTLSLAHASTRVAHAEEISIGVFPTITEITAESGQTLETQIEVKNFRDSSVTLTTLLQPFTASHEENGQVRYLSEPPDIFRTIQVFFGRERVNEVVLGPHEEKTLTMRIHIPEEQVPRDYYYSLVLLTKPTPFEEREEAPVTEALSTVSGGVASHFLVSVNPSRTRQLSVTEFSAPALTQKSPVTFTLRVGNDSPNFAKVEAQIQITNVFGTNIETIRLPRTTILAHSRRTFTGIDRQAKSFSASTKTASNEELEAVEDIGQISQNTSLIPGIYRATIALKSISETDNSTQLLSRSAYFVVAPLELIFIIFLGVVLISVIRRRAKKRFE